MGGTDLTRRPSADAPWNYRVVLRAGVYAIHEVVYHPDGRVVWVSAGPVPASGDDEQALVDDLRRQMAALDYPVLDWEAVARDARGTE